MRASTGVVEHAWLAPAGLAVSGLAFEPVAASFEPEPAFDHAELAKPEKIAVWFQVAYKVSDNPQGLCCKASKAR